MQVDLTRTEVHALIAACKDRRTLLQGGYQGREGEASSLAIALAQLDRIDGKLRAVIETEG